MKRFADLYAQLDSTTSISSKLDALVRYFSTAPHEDACWAVALLTGNRLKGIASTRVLQNLTIESANIPQWLFEACRATVGDLSETTALLLPEVPATHQGKISLNEVMNRFVLPLASLNDTAKADLIRSAWNRLDRHQRLVYHKIIRGGFRVGVQKRTVAKAIAMTAGLEPGIIEHRLSGPFSPKASAFAELIAPEGNADLAARPYPFFLARQLDNGPEQLGDPQEWTAEWKWDGIRAQCIVRADSPALWSRGEELITHQFPEITSAARSLPLGTVLDGEILIFMGEVPLPFAALQHRLNRKSAPLPTLFDRERVVFMAYDLLESSGRDIRDQPTLQRRLSLESLLDNLPDQTLRISPRLPIESWPQLSSLRDASRERGVEGLMLKHIHSTYGSGRTKPGAGEGWWKWKIDPFTLDAVLTHAYPGSGRRATLYTDYAFAVWNGSASPRVLTGITRAYSGLTQPEIEQLDAWIRRNTLRSMGPVREVKPEKVFEIAFEGIARSARHKSGLALRFPRILRERTDKPAHEANTIEDMLQLLQHPPNSRNAGEA